MTEPSSNVLGRLTEAIAASRELTDRQLNALAAKLERTNHRQDACSTRN